MISSLVEAINRSVSTTRFCRNDCGPSDLKKKVVELFQLPGRAGRSMVQLLSDTELLNDHSFQSVVKLTFNLRRSSEHTRTLKRPVEGRDVCKVDVE